MTRVRQPARKARVGLTVQHIESAGFNARLTFVSRAKEADMPVVSFIPPMHDTERVPEPSLNDRAAGYGVDSRITSVPSRQPLKRDCIWRVVLDGEAVVRVVRQPKRQGAAVCWQLLQTNDLTDRQLETYETALFSAGAPIRPSGHTQPT